MRYLRLLIHFPGWDIRKVGTFQVSHPEKGKNPTNYYVHFPGVRHLESRDSILQYYTIVFDWGQCSSTLLNILWLGTEFFNFAQYSFTVDSILQLCTIVFDCAQYSLTVHCRYSSKRKYSLNAYNFFYFIEHHNFWILSNKFPSTVHHILERPTIVFYSI